MKNEKSIVMKIMFVVLTFVLLFTITGCEPKKNEFTIRVFDMGINEEKKRTEDYYYDYTGSQIPFVIKIYCNDELIHETTLEYAINNEGIGSLITVRGYYKECYGDSYKQKQGDILPIKKGRYSYYIEFNRMYRWNNEIIQKHTLKDFYLTFYIDYDYYYSTKE